MRILVVDDSGTDRRFLGLLLEHLGHEVLLASSAEDATVVLDREDDVDLMMLDWNMPGLDGIELLHQLRRNPSTRSLPVLMVTSMATREHVAEAIRAGASEYVMKPATSEVLETKLAIVTEKGERPW